MRNRLLLLPALLLLLGAPVASACHTGVVDVAGYDDELRLYVEAKSATEAVLSLSADGGSLESATVFDANSGLTSTAQSPAALGRVVTTITLTEPMAAPFYLNLSKPIFIYLHWTSSSMSSQGRDGAHYRAEVLVGETRAGGDECVYPYSTAHTAWKRDVLKFRPEVSLIKAGDVVKLRLTRLTGTSDFRIGTGGERQTYAELHGYPFDPLNSLVYLENRRLVGLPPGTLAADQPPSPILQALPLAGLALLAVPRMRRKAPMAAILLLAGALSGCFGDDKPGASTVDPDKPQPTVQSNVTQDENLKKANAGSVRGFIHDPEGLPIRGAQITVLQTALFQRTDNYGRFAFPNVSAGSYLFRIDHKDFVPIEESITVRAGEIQDLNITMVRTGSSTGNRKAHPHDDWGGETKKLIWTADVVPSAGVYSLTRDAGHAYCPWFYATPGCEAPIPIDYDKPVPAGTGLVEITFRWDAPAFGANELGLRVVATTFNTSAEQVFIYRGSGDPFRIPIFPNEADPGHQKFTNWMLNIRAPGNMNLQHPFYPLISHTRTVHVEAVAYKGVVPYEPSHREFWGDRSEFALLKDAKIGPSSCQTFCDLPSTSYSWPVVPGSWVPPGTKEIRGTLTWANTNTSNQGTAWTVAYKGANSPNGRPVLKSPQTMMPGTNKLDFVIQVSPDDWDQFYQSRSAWIFYPDDGQAPVCPYIGSCVSPNTSNGTEWRLTATAYKDPNYVEEPMQ